MDTSGGRRMSGLWLRADTRLLCFGLFVFFFASIDRCSGRSTMTLGSQPEASLKLARSSVRLIGTQPEHHVNRVLTGLTGPLGCSSPIRCASALLRKASHGSRDGHTECLHPILDADL